MRLAPSFVQQPRLLLARAVAGSTTVGGSAAGCVRRLHCTCKAESQDCQQHNYSKFLHGFSPLKNQKWFCGPMAMPSAGEQEKLARVISRCEAGGWRGAYPCRCAKRAGEFSQNAVVGWRRRLKLGAGRKSLAGEMCGATVWGLEATVTSTGQQDMGPPRAGCGWLGVVGAWPPE